MPRCPEEMTLVGVGTLVCGCNTGRDAGVSMLEHKDLYWCLNGSQGSKGRHLLQFPKVYLSWWESRGVDVREEKGVVEVIVMYILWSLKNHANLAEPKTRKGVPTSLMEGLGATYIDQIKAKACELGVPEDPPVAMYEPYAQLLKDALVSNNANRALPPEVHNSPSREHHALLASTDPPPNF